MRITEAHIQRNQPFLTKENVGLLKTPTDRSLASGTKYTKMYINTNTRQTKTPPPGTPHKTVHLFTSSTLIQLQPHCNISKRAPLGAQTKLSIDIFVLFTLNFQFCHSLTHQMSNSLKRPPQPLYPKKKRKKTCGIRFHNLDFSVI